MASNSYAHRFLCKNFILVSLYKQQQPTAGAVYIDLVFNLNILTARQCKLRSDLRFALYVYIFVSRIFLNYLYFRF